MALLQIPKAQTHAPEPKYGFLRKSSNICTPRSPEKLSGAFRPETEGQNSTVLRLPLNNSLV